MLVWLPLAAVLLAFGAPQRAKPPQGAAAHDFHASLTEMQYNARTQSFEVSTRVFLDDLQAAIAAAYPGASTEVTERQAEPLLIAYFGRHFQVRDGTGRALELDFAGLEPEADVVWVYFSFYCPEAYRTASLRNTVLTDLFNDQMNLVNVTVGEQKASYVLSGKRPDATFEF